MRHRDSDHKHRHRISVRTDSRRSSCGCRGELTEVRAERNVQRWASIFRQAVCTALPLSHPGRNSVGWRRALCAAVSGIQQAQLTMPNGKFAIFRQAMCAARSCISIQQARLTMHGGKFLPAGFADAGDLTLIRQLTEADTADSLFSRTAETVTSKSARTTAR